MGISSSLVETFGLAYAGDSIVAILACQMAGAVASLHGPMGPFELSVAFLMLGKLLASLFWKEHVACGDGCGEMGSDDGAKSKSNADVAKPNIRDAIGVVGSDPKSCSLGPSNQCSRPPCTSSSWIGHRT